MPALTPAQLQAAQEFVTQNVDACDASGIDWETLGNCKSLMIWPIQDRKLETSADRLRP